MGKPSAPKAPDPYQSAAAQYQYGTQGADYNAALNRINSSGPTGSVNYSITGHDPKTGAPIYSQNTALSPEQQKLYEGNVGQQLGMQGLTNQAMGASAGTLSNPLGFEKGIPGIPGQGDLAGFTNRSRDAAYQQQTQYLDPQFKQQGEQLDASLRNSGAHPGDPAYDNAMKLFTNQKQQAYQSAFNNANQQGLAEQQALYGEGANTNQQLFGQGYQGASLPINLLNAMRSGSQVSMPGGQGLGNAGQGNVGIAPTDIQSPMNSAYQGQLNAYNAGTGSSNALMGDIGTLGAAYMMKGSDRRIKKHIHKIGKSALGLPVYLFHYLWDKDTDPLHVGVMAQHVERVLPEATARNMHGIRFVNYAMVK